ncbi:MAG: hypothetical protein WCG80_16695 [Spirochaetales bacterium]
MLSSRLDRDEVLGHAWVTGELALGSLKDRQGFLTLLAQLPQVAEVPSSRVHELTEEHHWFSRGIGWVDAQLLAACLSWPCRLWTHDKKLAELASELGVGAGA